MTAFDTQQKRGTRLMENALSCQCTAEFGTAAGADLLDGNVLKTGLL